MTRVIKANASQSQQARAAVLDLADFAAEARTVVLDARKDAARIVAEARAKADSAERQARQQGYAEGVARGQTDGYADGREQARAEVVRKFAEEYTELLTLGRNVVNDLTAARAEGLQHACDEIIEIAILLAGRIVSRVAAEDIEAAKANLVKVLERAHLGGQVVVKKLGGGERVVFDASKPPLGALAQTPEFSPNQRLLAFTARGRTEAIFVYDPANKRLRKIGGGCELTWFPDSQRVLWVENGGHGGNRILAMPLSSNKPKVFMDLPGSHSHEYFPRLSQDGRWLVWGASASGHEHDIADYELFLWRTDQPWDKAVRLTYNKANDRWPDIFIEK